MHGFSLKHPDDSTPCPQPSAFCGRTTPLVRVGKAKKEPRQEAAGPGVRVTVVSTFQEWPPPQCEKVSPSYEDMAVAGKTQ